MNLRRFAYCIVSFLYAGGALSSSGDAPAPYQWQIPAWLPPPLVPTDNPITNEKVELGRHLFYEKRLSKDGSISCATCHDQKFGFSDRRNVAVGYDGTVGKRNSMALVNVAYLPVLTWANPNLRSLEVQALIPLFSETPVEMGMGGHEKLMFARLENDPSYKAMFQRAFPKEDVQISLLTVTRALASFQRTLISANSPYDRYKYGGDSHAISKSAKRGEELFFSHRLECYHCHSGFNFTDNIVHSRSRFKEVGFHNNGLYNLDDKGSYPPGHIGLIEFTGDSRHMGAFRTPSLRNVQVTGPYMHDGSLRSIDAVLRHYSRGGTVHRRGPYAGDGAKNPNKDPLIVGPKLSAVELADLKAFLATLTDQDFLKNPRFSNPWTIGPNAKPEDRKAKFYNEVGQ